MRVPRWSNMPHYQKSMVQFLGTIVGMILIIGVYMSQSEQIWTGECQITGLTVTEMNGFNMGVVCNTDEGNEAIHTGSGDLILAIVTQHINARGSNTNWYQHKLACTKTRRGIWFRYTEWDCATTESVT